MLVAKGELQPSLARTCPFLLGSTAEEQATTRSGRRKQAIFIRERRCVVRSHASRLTGGGIRRRRWASSLRRLTHPPGGSHERRKSPRCPRSRPAPEMRLPPGVLAPFQWVRVRGNRAFISGHGAQASDGSPAPPFGRVPTQVTIEDAQASARAAALSMLASLRRTLGDIDRIAAWLVVSGMVNAEPGFARTTSVLNGFSDLILELYGPEAGHHARTAIGVAALPGNLPVVVSAEVEIAQGPGDRPHTRTRSDSCRAVGLWGRVHRGSPSSASAKVRSPWPGKSAVAASSGSTSSDLHPPSTTDKPTMSLADKMRSFCKMRERQSKGARGA